MITQSTYSSNYLQGLITITNNHNTDLCRRTTCCNRVLIETEAGESGAEMRRIRQISRVSSPGVAFVHGTDYRTDRPLPARRVDIRVSATSLPPCGEKMFTKEKAPDRTVGNTGCGIPDEVVFIIETIFCTRLK